MSETSLLIYLGWIVVNGMLLTFLIIILLLLSAFFSASETAFLSTNKIRIKNYAEDGRTEAKKALSIIENFDKTLATILVGNNLVNIAAATIAAQVATNLFGATNGVFISTFVMTMLVLIFGEVLPKSLAKENAEALTLKIAGILHMFIRLFYPLTSFLLILKRAVSGIKKEQTKIKAVNENSERE